MPRPAPQTVAEVPSSSSGFSALQLISSSKTQHGQVDRDGDVREASSWAETARAQGNVFPSAKREPIPDASPTTSSTVEDSFMVNNSPNDMVMLSEVHGLDYSAPRGDVVQIEEQA